VSATPKGKPGQAGLFVSQGTSGALVCAAMALLDPGDEIIIPDPYFVLYPRLAEMTAPRPSPATPTPTSASPPPASERLITPKTRPSSSAPPVTPAASSPPNRSAATSSTSAAGGTCS